MSEESSMPALVTYQGKEMLPEVVAYFTAADTARYDYEVAAAEAQHAWRATERKAKFEWAKTARPGDYWDIYDQRRRNPELNEAHTEYQKVTTELQTKLNVDHRAAVKYLMESKDPMVVWIANNSLTDEQGNSELVLKALPVADSMELWEVKERHGMCREFDRLYAAAEADGAFNGGVKPPGHRELLALRNKISREWGNSHATQLMTHLRPYVKALNEAHAEEIAALKAEWQGLDEAWRSERSRRGAETRRANAEAEAEAIRLVEEADRYANEVIPTAQS